MPLVYKLRENDIVDSRLELEQSLINNLAVFFDVLPGKMQYEVKLVSSITTADGTTQKGASQKVKTGTYKNGTPKYKTVVNKFAVADVYIIIPGQSRKKLTRLVLAPVNILNYNPNFTDLQTFNNSIGILVSSTIKENPVIQTPTAPTQPNPTAPIGTALPVSTSIPPVVKPGANATTLFEWYQAQGLSVPSIGSRAILFEEFDLGPASTYVGTSEQNGKLLEKLKSGIQQTVKAPQVDTGWRFYSFSVNGEEYIEVLPWVGNVPFGYTPLTKEEYLTKKQAMLSANLSRWKPFFDQMAEKETKALAGGKSGYTIVDGVPWLTASLNQEQIYEQAVKDGKMKKVPIGNGFGYIAI